ncbi:NAD(P)H-dependent flavin oxidoreductase [Peptoniphilus raoultii]|uniref:NAD(P)H-dependent flavin oxidoreductase n=1 Tax=Peptoniphilus raoultii TaxID=1776387 RepID=UPI0008D969CC|nr:nitronate monooxygenase [Peptoniphilus raoultii]
MRLDKILNIKYPFIQGGMANISKGKFASDVSNAGGLGLIGTGGMDAEDLKKEIAIAKENTDKLFGVNLLLLNPEIDRLVDLVISEDIKFITTGAGNPGKFMKRFKERGIIVFPIVSNTSLAIRMERLGADGIIVEGEEAAGHIGELSTMVLLPEVATKVKIPVIAAGGIASGRQIFAAEVLGASGIQFGTSMLFTEECPIHENYKNRLLQAKSSNVTVIGTTNGYRTRVLKNKMARKYLNLEREEGNKLELEKLTLGALKKAVFNGDMEEGSIMAGEVVGTLDKIYKIEELFQKFYGDYERIKKSYEKSE